MEIYLKEIASARSGDKGSCVNIGVIANNEMAYELIKREATVEAVGNFFGAVNPKKVNRYLWHRLFAINFLLEGVLVGGGSMNLRLDGQGKSFGVALLNMPIQISEEEWKRLR